MIQNLFVDQELYVPVSCVTQSNLNLSIDNLFLAKEHTMSLFVNHQFTHRFVCSPAQLTELCLGWLCSEGYISSPDEGQNLFISEDGRTARISLSSPRKSKPDPFYANIIPDKDLIPRANRLLQTSDSVYAKTRSTHGCIYIEDDSQIFCEDISRNNALDKTIGSVLIQGKNPQNGLLLFSGRVSSEIVLKTAYAGIPVLASKSAATAEALETARQLQQVLFFFNDGDSYTRAAAY